MVNTSMSDAEYKAFIQARVSNQTGTTLTEVIAVTLAGIAASAMATIAFEINKKANPWDARLLEFSCLVPPLLYLATVNSVESSIFAAATFLVVLIMMLPSASSSNTGDEKKTVVKRHQNRNRQQQPGPSSSFNDADLSLLRGSLLVQTVVAILAVDFAPFPARFIKTETFGISLMDIGVGAFVFTSALSHTAAQFKKLSCSVSASASAVGKTMRSASRGKSLSSSVARHEAAGGFSSIISWLKNQGPLRSGIPLLVLGFCRLAAVKGSDYQEHVSEYGVHWNFFFTLGTLPILVAVAHGVIEPLLTNRLFFPSSSSSSAAAISTPMLDFLAGAALLALHQTLLSSPSVSPSLFGVPGSLTEYVLSPHRRTLIEANKEGVVSAMGYAALFLLSSALYGFLVFGSNGRTTKKEPRAVAAFVVGALACYGASVQETNVQQTSRRMCNAPYVLVCIGIGFISYGLCCLVVTTPINTTGRGNGNDGGGGGGGGGEDVQNTSKHSPQSILSCIPQNQLALFMFANLLTGAVNMSMRTVFASNAVAYLVLAGYVTCVLVVAGILAERGIKIKL